MNFCLKGPIPNWRQKCVVIGRGRNVCLPWTVGHTEGEAPHICHPFTWFINRSRYSWSLQTTMRRSGSFAGFRQFLSNAFKRILRLLTHFLKTRRQALLVFTFTKNGIFHFNNLYCRQHDHSSNNFNQKISHQELFHQIFSTNTLYTVKSFVVQFYIVQNYTLAKQ